MSNHEADHALGLELRLEELVEQAARAEVQGRTDDAEALQSEIAALQQELATTAERAASGAAEPAIVHAEHPDAEHREAGSPGGPGGEPG
ncbi:MAG: hypothetical protein ACR2KC_07350 [Acidimicrobiales bacterium]